MPLWTWSPTTRRYRLTTEGAAKFGNRAGTFISFETIQQLSIDYVERSIAQLDTSRLSSGAQSIQQWVEQSRTMLLNDYIAQYALGKGGITELDSKDINRLSELLLSQFQYLNDFANAIVKGQLSEAAILDRLSLYTSSSRQAFERANAAMIGADLPAYPGDGTTVCRTRCNCTWRIVETDTMFKCYWTIRPGENCPDCVARARKWNPIQVLKLN